MEGTGWTETQDGGREAGGRHARGGARCGAERVNGGSCSSSASRPATPRLMLLRYARARSVLPRPRRCTLRELGLPVDASGARALDSALSQRLVHGTAAAMQKKGRKKKTRTKKHKSARGTDVESDEEQAQQGKSYNVVVPRNGVKFTFSRSSGPGGQNVNKVSTRATLRFHLDRAGWLPPEVRERLAAQEPSRINKQGEFALSSDVHRTQPRNIEDCLRRLQAIVDVAAVAPKVRKMRTGLGEETKRRRRESKRRRSQVKSGRSKNFSKDMF